jgi:hypothetical protein
MRHTRHPAVLSAALLALCLPLAAQKRATPKQELTFPDLLKAATTAFEGKDFGAAVSALQEALRMAQQKQRDAIVAALPKPDGWKVEDEGNDAVDNPFLGGLAALGSTITRRYTKGEQSLSIEVIANSPVAQMVSMMLTNPALLAAQEGEVVEYGAHKALLKKDGDDAYELQILMHGKHLVTARSTKLTDKELFAIVDQKAIDALDKQLGK